MLIGNIHFRGRTFLPANAIIDAAEGLTIETPLGVRTVTLGAPNTSGLAVMTMDREIVAGGFSLIIAADNNPANARVLLSGSGAVVIQESAGGFRADAISPGTAQIQMNATTSGTAEGGFVSDGVTGQGIWVWPGGTIRIGLFPTAAGNDNGALLQVAGTMTNGFFTSPQTTTPIAVSSANDLNKVFTNEGAAALVQFNLPGAAAGRQYEFIVQDAVGITVDAAAGDTIRIGTSVTAASGSITSTTVGSTIKLKAINATEWIATSMMGAWTI